MELKVETRNVELRKSWQEKIDGEKAKLIRHYANFIHHLRVSIEANTHHKEGGFQVKLVASVPQDTVVVTRKGEKIRAILTEAFDVLALRLKEIQRKKRKNVKKSAGGPTDSTGVIRMVSPHESYGFIMGNDQREIYFHENALKDLSIDKLTEGDLVIFGETLGDNGPQASWVRAVR